MDYDPCGNKKLAHTLLTREATLFAFAVVEHIVEQTIVVS
jgi:hypothetical protein